MFDSLETWCNMPFNHYAYLNTSLSGDKTFAPPMNKLGYVVDKITEIIDKNGSQCISSTQVYTSDNSINVTDKISVGIDNKQREIKAVGVFSDGNTGAESIRVIYL